jgi:Ran GTPase-activating protein 1
MADDEADVEVIIRGEDKRIETSEDAEYIVEEIRRANGLTTLKLSGNSYGTEAASHIGQAISTIPTLRNALWSDMFVSRLKTEIPPALTALGDGLIAANAHLVELDLSDNAFGPAGVESLKSLLTSEVCYSLKILKFNNNGLGIGGGKILSEALLLCHQQASESGLKFALEVFQSGRNRLENEGAMALAEVFGAIDSLVELSMPQNGIYHDGISALASALKNNLNLNVINLSDNTFSELGSSIVADVLPSLQNLKIINFNECLIKSEGAVAIAASLNDGHLQLEELHLSYNELNSKAGNVIVQSMGNKEQLKVLDLNGKSIYSI